MKGDSEALTRESNVNKCMGSEAREMRRSKSVGRLMGINKSGSRLDLGLSPGFSVKSAEQGRYLLLGDSSIYRPLLSPSGVHWQCPAEVSTGPLRCPIHRVLTNEVSGICP